MASNSDPELLKIRRKYTLACKERDAALDSLARAARTIARLKSELLTMAPSYSVPLPPNLGLAGSDDEYVSDPDTERGKSVHVGSLAAQREIEDLAETKKLARKKSTLPPSSSAAQQSGNKITLRLPPNSPTDIPTPTNSAPPSKKRASTAMSSGGPPKKIVPPVVRDQAGNPILPLQAGVVTLVSLGKVDPAQSYHTERYIFPVGYIVNRIYNSMINPDLQTTYTCKVLKGVDGPQFQVTSADQPDNVIVSGTATGSWSSIVKAANAVREKASSNSVSGPEMYGFGNSTVRMLIQELDGASDLPDYQWQQFEIAKPSKRSRLAASKKAASLADEDHDGNMTEEDAVDVDDDAASERASSVIGAPHFGGGNGSEASFA